MNAVERTLLLQKLLTVLIFPTQISIELKTAGILEHTSFGQTTISQRAGNGTLFDVRWSLVAQAIPENELFLSQNRYHWDVMGYTL